MTFLASRLFSRVRRSSLRLGAAFWVATLFAGHLTSGNAHAAGGAAFFSLDFSTGTKSLDVTAADPDTLLPLPTAFHADDEGVYSLEALLLLAGETESPIGSFEISGREDTGIQLAITISAPIGVGPGIGPDLANFAGIIAGAEIVDIDNEAARRSVDASLSARSIGAAGSPPITANVNGSTFMGTSDGKEAYVDQAHCSLQVDIPGEANCDIADGAIPPIPDDSMAESFNMLILQSGSAVFDITSSTNFTLEWIYGANVAQPVRNPADFDGDGDVDGDDFLTWQANFGKASGASPMDGDADGDGDVDGNDFLVWQSNFTSLATGTTASVPEPTSLALLLLVAIAALRCRRC